MNPLLIRPFLLDDAPAVEALLDSLWSHDPTMRSIYRIHRDYAGQAPQPRITLVAEAQGELVGVGTLFASSFHPQMPLVALHVAQPWQRRGVGTALYAALQGYGDARPWCAKLTRRDASGMAFLERRGYRALVQTMMGVIDPTAATTRQWLAGLPDAVPGCAVLGLEEAAAVTLEEFAQVQAAIYTQFHQWNPPSEKIAEQAEALFCGPNVIAGSNVCVLDGEQLVGAGNLLADPIVPDRPEAYLVNFGALAAHPEHDRITAVLLHRLLTMAAERGLRVRFEADSTYLPHHTLLSQAPAVEVDRDFCLMANSQ